MWKLSSVIYKQTSDLSGVFIIEAAHVHGHDHVQTSQDFCRLYGFDPIDRS
jgi:hypothetical protein